MTQKMDPPSARNLKIGEEAAEWLLRLHDIELDPRDRYFDPDIREQAFLKWICSSTEHLRIYFETRETLLRLRAIDAKHGVDIEEMLAARHAEVIPLFGHAVRPNSRGAAGRVAMAAAAIVLILVGVTVAWIAQRSPEFATGVGEQRTCKLQDGSFVYLNTDSRVRVDFSKSERHIELLRGEALFVVEHNPTRPFLVSANLAKIRAIGTQFNVRRRAEDTDVTVVEGVVQVTGFPIQASSVAEAPTTSFATSARVSTESPPTVIRLAAGEEASVIRGRINKEAAPSVADTLSWRQRRLVFHKTPLAEVAAEFNRYNQTRITVNDLPGGGMQLTGVFDADSPMALIRYAQQYDTLSVLQQGGDWVIRPR